MGDVAGALRDAAARLGGVSATARLDAELLMAEALGVTRSELLLRRQGDRVPARFAALLARRLCHEPVAYLLGHQAFYGLEFTVGPAVLIPRADTELLIDTARAVLAARPPARVLDLGVGSGALLLAALSLWPEARGTGVDCSAEALACAAANAGRLGLLSRATLRRADWREADWSAGMASFDLILANPPYVEDAAPLAPDVRRYEPAVALFAGPDGLEAYRALLPQLDALLAEGGIALVEIGHEQAAAVTEIATAAGLVSRLHHDLAGRPRALRMSRG